MGQSSSSGDKGDAETPVSADLVNTLDEIAILEGHSDIVRVVVLISPELVATASDDCTIRIWDWRTATLVSILSGHKRPITCLLPLSPRRLASGSSDEKIFLWNVQTGAVVRELAFHAGGAVQCIVKLGENRLCSGSHDRTLFVWDHDGNEVGRIERHENENLQCLLFVANRIVTASSSPMLLVYNPETWAFTTALAYHREAVTCLERVSQTQFASGSLDGAIVVWHADTLKPARVLAFPDRYRSDISHSFPFHVRSLAVSQRYMVCAIGNGFALFDLFTGERVLDRPDAHDAPCRQVLPLYHWRKLVSCSDDSSIRLWGSPHELDELARAGGGGGGGVWLPDASASSSMNSSLDGGGSPAGGAPSLRDSAATPFRNLFSSGKKKPRVNQPLLLGDLTVHSAPVEALASVNQTTFVSVSGDGLVVLWKDGRVQKQLRNNLASASLLGGGLVGSAPESGGPSMRSQELQSLPASGGLPGPGHVPSYVLEFARSLLERGLTVDQAMEHLTEQQQYSTEVLESVRAQLKG